MVQIIVLIHAPFRPHVAHHGVLAGNARQGAEVDVVCALVLNVPAPTDQLPTMGDSK